MSNSTIETNTVDAVYERVGAMKYFVLIIFILVDIACFEATPTPRPLWALIPGGGYVVFIASRWPLVDGCSAVGKTRE